MWWTWAIVLIGVILIGYVIISLLFKTGYFIIIRRVITNDIVPGIEYVLPKPSIARFIAVKSNIESETQYIKPGRGTVFLETYDVEGKNDLLNTQLLVVRKVCYDKYVRADSGDFIIYKRNNRYYTTRIKENMTFCSDYKHMIDKGIIQSKTRRMDVSSTWIVTYESVWGVVSKSFDCYKPTNNKKGLD